MKHASLKKNLTPERIDERLAAGEDVQNVLMDLANMTQTEAFTLIDLNIPLKMLIKKGARVATGESGCAFEVMIRNQGAGQTLIFSNAMNDMLAKEGEFPLHIIARDRPNLLWTALTMSVSEKICQGLGKVDTLGRTPSHLLWASDGALTKQSRRARVARNERAETANDLAKIWSETVRTTWGLQQLICDSGLSMHAPDHAGDTPMSLCIDRLCAGDAGVLEFNPLCEQVLAYRNHRTMSGATASTGAGKAGPRF